jgi:uncharacterized SAM-binding protein YcdF (DUF218 family)
MQTLILILGYTNDEHGELSPVAKSRLNKGIEVLSEYPEASVLLTGGFGDHFNTTDLPHAHYSKKYLLAQGADEGRIVKDFALSLNTIQDSEKCEPIVNALNPDKIILVTSEFHMARANFLFTHRFPTRTITCIKAVSPLSTEELAPLHEHEAKQLHRLQQARNQQ